MHGTAPGLGFVRWRRCLEHPGGRVRGELTLMTALRSLGPMTLHVVIERGEDGYYSARCPSLKSCWSQGRTWEEALKNIQEAIELFLEPSPQELRQDQSREVVTLTL